LGLVTHAGGMRPNTRKLLAKHLTEEM